MDVGALAATALLLLLATVTRCSHQAGGGRSPHESGLRPAPPLEEAPPPDLVEHANRTLDPPPSELNAVHLRHKLGRNLDPLCMSVTRPHDLGDRSEFPFRRNRRGRLVPTGAMPAHLRDINFNAIRLPDGSKVRTRVSARLQKKLQQFLWAFTSCPIAHRWKDLGARFWPRWLREGHCPAGKQSCSIPPGMKCRPAATVHKTILRWHCRAGRGCQWIKVEYPVVTECQCAGPSAAAANNSYS